MKGMKIMKGTAEPTTRAEAQGTQRGTADKYQRVWKTGSRRTRSLSASPLMRGEAGWG